MGTGVSLSSQVPLEYLPVFSLVAPEDYDRNPSKYTREKAEEGGDTEDTSMTWIRSTRSALMQQIYRRRAFYQKYSSRLDSTGTYNFAVHPQFASFHPFVLFSCAEKLNEILPEYSVVYLVYVLAHAPFYTSTNNPSQFNRVKQCAFFRSRIEPFSLHCSYTCITYNKYEGRSKSFIVQYLNNMIQS